MNKYFTFTYNETMKRENIIRYGTPIVWVALVAILGSIFTNDSDGAYIEKLQTKYVGENND